MKLRLATPRHLIGLRDIQELKDIGPDGPRVIGAMIRHHELQASEVIAVSLSIVDAGREAC